MKDLRDYCMAMALFVAAILCWLAAVAAPFVGIALGVWVVITVLRLMGVGV